MSNLKTQALKACLDIYNNYDEQELSSYSIAVHEAWCVGKQLEELQLLSLEDKVTEYDMLWYEGIEVIKEVRECYE